MQPLSDEAQYDCSKDGDWVDRETVLSLSQRAESNDKEDAAD
jgi:hypothetical protein